MTSGGMYEDFSWEVGELFCVSVSTAEAAKLPSSNSCGLRWIRFSEGIKNSSL